LGLQGVGLRTSHFPLEGLQIGAGGEATKGDPEMKKGRFTQEQIIGVLKQHEAGRKYRSWHGGSE
jgi:hypothetical protein